MERWTVEDNKEEGYRWKKEPVLGEFPLPGQNLANALLEHWERDDTHHYIVFSDKETAEIERLGSPFVAFLGDGILWRMVVGPLRDSRQGFIQSVYVPADTPNHRLGKSPMQLGIEFNRRG